MKLAQLFEGPEFPWHEQRDMPRRSDKAMQATVKSRMSDSDVEYVGSGASAFVSRSTSPHHMDSVERISLNEDPTAVYLTTIHNTPALHDNPYFPKVRSVVQQGTSASVVAERLRPYRSEKLFTQRLVQAVWDVMTDEPFPEDQEEQYFAIEKFIDDVLKGRKKRQVKDERLIQAAQVIQQIKKQTHGGVDIHDGNIMWRITGTMPQLVIVDPLS